MIRLPASAHAGTLLGALLSLGAQAQTLPEGDAKGMVQGVRKGCHQTSEILRSSGYTREGWKELFGTRIDLSASPAERDRIAEHLATYFPPNASRAESRAG